jgi:PEGA domain
MLFLSPRRLVATLAALLSLAAVCSAQSLKITSNPPGATVELDGVPTGATPLGKKFPGGYFHRTKTEFGQRLEHPMVARVSLNGFVIHEIALSEGPMDWMIFTAAITANIGCSRPIISTSISKPSPAHSQAQFLPGPLLRNQLRFNPNSRSKNSFAALSRLSCA